MVSTRRRPNCSRRLALAGLASSLLTPAWAQQATQVEDKNLPPPQVGSLLPLPELTLLDGTRFRGSDADGHVLVLYWWASWCPFCAQQSPSMDKFWVANKARGLLMLGLSIDRKAEDASTYLSRKGYTFPAGLVTPAVARVLPKPKGLPVTIVRGRDGRVLAAETGQLFPEDIEQFARFL
jgi:thiol-disulfide isomerase/thioredoxin